MRKDREDDEQNSPPHIGTVTTHNAAGRSANHRWASGPNPQPNGIAVDVAGKTCVANNGDNDTATTYDSAGSASAPTITSWQRSPSARGASTPKQG